MALETAMILGRQPEFGVAELISLAGNQATVRRTGVVALWRGEQLPLFSRLGGSQKAGRLLARLPLKNWQSALVGLPAWLEAELPASGKLRFGLSIYNLPFTRTSVVAIGLELKRRLTKSNRPVRFVPPARLALNSAQVHHNSLLAAGGVELLLIADGPYLMVARTIWVQDIDGYAARDQSRPQRDARAGMLPPKLAQIIVNLAAGPASPDGRRLLDPFCGSGVILQEAAIMGFRALGSDINSRSVQAAASNMDWLQQQTRLKLKYNVSVADATQDHWPQFDVIATETALGPPLKQSLSPSQLQNARNQADNLVKAFLLNVGRQARPGLRLCLAVAAWPTGRGFVGLPCLDQLSIVGYNRLSLTGINEPTLIYHRPGQLVGRELVIAERSGPPSR